MGFPIYNRRRTHTDRALFNLYFPFKKPNSNIFYHLSFLASNQITLDKFLNNFAYQLMKDLINFLATNILVTIQNNTTKLKSANYDYNWQYQKKFNKNKKKRRKRKIIYFNPSFSLTVATRIGEKFLKLIN